MDKKRCAECERLLPIEQFWKRKKSKDGRDRRCGDCARAYHRDIYRENPDRKRQVRKASSTHVAELRRKRDEVYDDRGGCADCGIQDKRVLEFDHVRGAKEFNVATGIKRQLGWGRIAAEIAKCDVVCANCHRIRTLTRLDSAGDEAALIRR